MREISPIYVDGPLAGHELPTDQPTVRAAQFRPDPGPLDAGFATREEIVEYKINVFAFRLGDEAVLVHIGWCSGADQPDASAVARALFRDTVIDRARVMPLPPDYDSLDQDPVLIPMPSPELIRDLGGEPL